MATHLLSSFKVLLLAAMTIMANCNGKNTDASPKDNSDNAPTTTNLLGQWTYTMQICGSNDAPKKSTFTVNITKDRITLEGNEIECNACHKQYQLKGNQITFPEKFSSAVCTEMYCESKFSYCRGETQLTHLFNDMEYQLADDKLTLTRDGRSLTLTKKQGEE